MRNTRLKRILLTWNFVIRALAHRWRRTIFEWLGSDRYSFVALNELDRKLAKHLDFRGGTFIEAGANDGITQSNTYWFERFRGWRGLLIEAVPRKSAECRRNRPNAIVVNSAMVASDDITSITMKTANLMAYVVGSFTKSEDEATHLANAERVQALSSVTEVSVPASRLSTLLDAQNMPQIDLFSLDVEGYEAEVLKGLDLTRHKQRFILVETKDIAGVLNVLKQQYTILDQLSFHDYLLKAE